MQQISETFLRYPKHKSENILIFLLEFKKQYPYFGVLNFNTMEHFVKKPCKNCPFRNDVKPYLHPERAAEIAYAAQNKYSDFTCHSTIEYDGDEDHQGRPTGDFSRAKTCAGFLTLSAQNGERIPEGFEPSWELCYTDAFEMIDAYEEAYNKDKH